MNRVEFVHGLNAPREQFADNIAVNIKRNLPRFRTKRSIIVGGGPSAADHIEDIREDRRNGWGVIAVNGAHDWLIRHEIRPDACVLMDSTDLVATFIKRPQLNCQYYLASQCHPLMFEKLAGFRVSMWHAFLDEESNKFIEEHDPEATIMSGANTVGLHAIALEYFKGVRKLRLYGFDSSHRPSGDHAYDNSQQKPVDEIEFFFKGERFLSTGTRAAQAEMFARFWRQYFKLGMRIEVIGDGLLPAMARHEKETLMAELKGN
jgi:hypothetical protein